MRELQLASSFCRNLSAYADSLDRILNSVNSLGLLQVKRVKYKQFIFRKLFIDAARNQTILYSFTDMNLLDNQINVDWLEAIQKNKDPKATLLHIGIVGGGSINDARKIDTSAGTFFAKLNDSSAYVGMLAMEARGLNFLIEKSRFNIPKPIATGISDDIQWIIMEYIGHGAKKDDFWENFGLNLAKMHKHSNETFGFDSDNYLGNLPQKNDARKTWSEFYAEMRIGPQLKMAKDQGFANSEMVRQLEKVMNRVERYFPEEKPAALHGDLWTGNFTTDATGEATIFDPATYYGHREMDIAMSKLFGGFDNRFYEAYNAEFPLEKGWEERLPIANLYPLLAHLNIFGGTYAFQIMNILRKNV